MNKSKALSFLNATKSKPVTVGDTTVVFSRQCEDDIYDIEKMPDDELVAEWKELVYINYIYGQVSIGELQRITLIDMELKCRQKSISLSKLTRWFKTEKRNHNQNSD